jgi:hypothetical protein
VLLFSQRSCSWGACGCSNEQLWSGGRTPLWAIPKWLTLTGLNLMNLVWNHDGHGWLNEATRSKGTKLDSKKSRDIATRVSFPYAFACITIDYSVLRIFG